MESLRRSLFEKLLSRAYDYGWKFFDDLPKTRNRMRMFEPREVWKD